ncbi:MAG TPA: SapC family protein [Roseiarcus sp.]|jgi:hypothetical protein
MATAQAPTSPLSGQVMFYRQPELLTKDQHGKLGVNVSPTRFTFALGSHVCPLTVHEFAAASTCYPIIFVGQDYNPVCVLGVAEGQNLFATPEKGFDNDTYIPAFIRRYPFVLASPGAGQASAEDRMLVGIDRAYEYISENAAYPFFDKNGEPTDYTQRCMQFCNDFEAQARSTQNFVKTLRELDLIEHRNTTYTPQNQDGTPAGEPQLIAEYFSVSDEKLKALSKDQIADLVASGAMQQIYGQINSLFAWDRLLARHFQRWQEKEQAEAAANA